MTRHAPSTVRQMIYENAEACAVAESRPGVVFELEFSNFISDYLLTVVELARLAQVSFAYRLFVSNFRINLRTSVHTAFR